MPLTETGQPRRRRWRAASVVLVCALGSGVLVMGHRAGWLPAGRDPGVRQGRLIVREPTGQPVAGPSGLQRLDAVGAPDSLLYAPASRAPGPSPLVVMFHGAGGAAEQGLRLVRREADARGALVLSMKSTGTTWDVIAGSGFGPDLERLEAALTYAVATHPIDPRRMAVGGFSDGASYALSVGLTNGDVFGQVIAFSPGFMAAARHHGKPGIFISHGDRDTVLPIDATSRRLVPRLRDEYVVEYVEFHGGHGVPADVADRAFRSWLPN